MIDQQKTVRRLFRRPDKERSRVRRNFRLDLGLGSDMKLEDRTLLTGWVPLGPAPITNGQTPGNAQPVSGRITGIATSPSDAGTYYITAAGGGVWKTSNAGASWTPLTDGLPTLAMGAIAVAPSDANVVYAGTGEANNSGDSNYGVGILRSTNAGASWTLSEGPNNIFETSGLTTSKIAVDPANPNIVYAAMGNVGENKGFTNGAGLYKSIDGGVTWTNTTASIENNVTYSDVVINPTTPSTLYMAIGSFYASTNGGVYESTNSGGTWTALNIGMANTNFGRISLALAPSNPQVVYATVESASTSGVLLVARTDNGGSTWTDVTPGENYMGGQGWYDQWVIVNPTNPANVFVAGSPSNSDSILESTDSGVTWNDIGFSSSANGGNGPHADHHAVAYTADGKLLDGNDGGIWRLDDPGVNTIQWTGLNTTISTIQFEGISLSPTDPTVALGGSQDNGTERYSGSVGWTLTDGGDGGEVEFSHQNPNIAYHVAPIASFGAGNYFRKSTDGGKTWGSYANGLPSSGAEPGPGQSTNFYAPFQVDPNNDQRVILGSSDLYITTDGANTWTNLTAGKPGWPETNPTDALAISNTNGGNTIYASVGNGSGSTIVVSTNDGATWSDRSLPSGTGRVSDLEIDPTNDQVAYATTSSFASTPGHVWRTTNGGLTWTNISGNLPDLPTWTLQIDTNNANTLYIGNDTGVFVTSNLGSSWSPMGTGLPNAQVLQLSYNATYSMLGAATHGRGMFEIPTQAVTVSIVNPASASPNPVNGRSTQLSVLATDPAGESTLTYTWTTTAAPAGAPAPTFTFNGSNAAKNDGVVFYAAGYYTFQVKVRNLAGQSVTSSVTVDVNAVLTSITITPTKAQLSAGGTEQLAAFSADQFGNPISSTPLTAVWRLTSGNGTVSSTGLYTAPALGTVATVSATASGFTKIATIYVLSNPWLTTDVGTPSVSGNASDNGTGTFTVLGAGASIAGIADQFRYTYLTLTGNSTIEARVSNEQNTGIATKAGVMYRSDNTPGAMEVMIAVTPGQGLVYEYRTATGGATSTFTSLGLPSAPYVRLVRVGNVFTASYSLDGINWTQDGSSVAIAMGGTAEAGLALSSGSSSTLNTTVFDHVLADSIPTIAITASVNPSPVTTSTATLSVLGADNAGESALSYTWRTTSQPIGSLPPTFSTNASNAAKIDTVTFYKAGNYTFLVTATNVLGYSVTSSVSVSVIATASIVKMTPTTANVFTGGTVQFVTALYDQFGVKVAVQPQFTYSMLAGGAGGRVSSTGLYTAPSNRTGVDHVEVFGAGSAAVATVYVTFSSGAAAVRSPISLPSATVGSVSAGWGTSGSASLVTAADGLRLLPVGRMTDLPWENIRSLVVNLSRAEPLSPADVRVTGIKVANYGPVSVSLVPGSTSSYLITLAQPISSADRVTLTIGNSEVATYTRRLDVLPGDVNDDGVVNSADATIATSYLTSLFIFADVLGEGSVTSRSVKTIQLLNGTRLPVLS